MAKFIMKIKTARLVSRKTGSGKPSKITAEIKATVEPWMREEDKTTAYQLHSLLVTHRFRISRGIVLRCHESKAVLTAN